MFLHSDNDTSPVFRICLNSGQAFCNNHLILPFEASSPPEFPPEFLRFHPMIILLPDSFVQTERLLYSTEYVFFC